MRRKGLSAVLAGSLAAAVFAADAGHLADVRRIYDKLARAAGDGRRPPALVLRPEGGDPAPLRVAYYDQASRRISIDERVVGYCFEKPRPQAEACVAFFLGHELAHFYKDHAWGSDFPASFSGNGGPVAGVTGRLAAFEAQADEAGGLYARMAGYDALAEGPRILADIYRIYGLAAAIPGYPSLDERQQIARRALITLDRMTPVFDLGLLLFALDRYEEAGRCFDWIAQSFPSREILNNAAVAKALAAAALFPAGRRAAQYPWTLDGETRLAAALEASRGEESEPPAERRARLLDEARADLEMAVSKDPDYAAALLNLALVEDLREEYGSAADHLRKARELAAAAPAFARLCAAAQKIVGAHAAGAAPPGDVFQRSAAPAPAAVILEGLPEPSAVRFAADQDDAIEIAASAPGQPGLRIETRNTPDFTAIRLRAGARKLLAIGGAVDRNPLSDPVARAPRPAPVERSTAFGLLDLYPASRLLIYRDGPRILRWLRWEWVD